MDERTTFTPFDKDDYSSYAEKLRSALDFKFFQVNQNFENQLGLKEKEFIALTQVAVKQVEDDNPGLNLEPQKERLNILATFCFRANAFFTQGDDASLGAKLAFSYGLAQAVNEAELANLGLGKDQAFQLFTENYQARLDAIRNAGSALNIFPQSTKLDEEERFKTQVYPFTQLMEQIHPIKCAVLAGKGLREYTKQHSYLPLVLTIHSLADHMTAKAQDPTYYENIFQAQQDIYYLDLLAFSLTHAERSPQDLIAGDSRLQLWWGKTVSGLRDYLARETTPSVFALGNLALGVATGIPDFNQRWLIGGSLKLSNFYPIKTFAVKAPSVARRPVRPARQSEIAAHSVGLSGSQIAGLTGESRLPTAIIDSLMPKLKEDVVIQQAIPKSVWSSLVEVFSKDGVVKELKQLGNKYGISQEHFDHPFLYTAVRARLVLFNELINQVSTKAGNTDIPEFMSTVFVEITNLEDIMRLRVYFKRNKLDKFCHHVLGQDSPARLLFEKRTAGRTISEWTNLRNYPKKRSIEKEFARWMQDAKKEEAERAFCTVFVHRQLPMNELYAQGDETLVNTEVQILRQEDLANSWNTRMTFKLLSKEYDHSGLL